MEKEVARENAPIIIWNPKLAIKEVREEVDLDYTSESSLNQRWSFDEDGYLASELAGGRFVVGIADSEGMDMQSGNELVLVKRASPRALRWSWIHDKDFNTEDEEEEVMGDEVTPLNLSDDIGAVLRSGDQIRALP